MNLIIHDNKVLKSVETDLFTGWAPATEFKLTTEKPQFRWKRAKISFNLWAEIVCYLRWTQKEHGEEAMITLFYHMEEDRWAAWAFPQEPNGMTVKLLPNEPEYKKDRAQFGKGWIQAGSVHHHCKAPAFQSSTDKDDECNRDGVHITLGKMDEKVLDVHVRQVFEGCMSDTTLKDWIQMPDWMVHIPECLRMHYFDIAIKAIENHPYPKEWEERIYERIPVKSINHPITPGHHANPTVPTSNHTANSGNSGRRNGRKQTLITAGAATTDSRVGNNQQPHKFSDHPQLHFLFQERIRNDLIEITTSLNITLREAHKLLDTIPDHTWEQSDMELRKVIIEFLRTRNIPILYAEQSIENALGITPYRVV